MYDIRGNCGFSFGFSQQFPLLEVVWIKVIYMYTELAVEYVN